MKVFLAYKLYYENDGSMVDHKDDYRISFLEAYKDDPNFSLEVRHFGDRPGDIKSGKELNQVLQAEDFDIAFILEELEWVVNLETAKKLGKKLFLVHIDTWAILSPNVDINYRIIYKKPRVWSALNQPLSIQQLSEYCNVLVTDYGYGEIFPNVYAIIAPQDTRYLKIDKSIEKNINVSHMGMLYTNERIKYHDIFKKANLNIFYSGGMNKRIYPAKQLSKEEYAKVLQSSKITLEMNGSVLNSPINPEFSQRKGKLVQAGHCGTFCLVSHPEVHRHKNGAWFTEGTHFDSITYENCVDKIRYYLNNPEKAQQMAEALNDQVLKHHSPKSFWESIFKYSKDK